MARPRVLITGATGFVGQAVCRQLVAHAHAVAATRGPIARLPEGVAAVPVGEIGMGTDWRRSLEGIDIVIHLASRAHVLKETVRDPDGAYRVVNVEGARRLAWAAAEAGARRLVYASSVKVMGEETGERPFRDGDTPVPLDAYGRSKLEAERALAEVAAATGLELAILRPPLVYGPGVKGNLRRLLELCASGLPLPLGGIHNRRSMIGVDNLADALIRCAFEPAAAGRTFLVRDGEDLSTTELVTRMAQALGKRPLLLPVPAALLDRGLRVVGATDVARRLFGSLVIDDSEIRTALGWRPPYAVSDTLAAMAAAYMAERGEPWPRRTLVAFPRRSGKPGVSVVVVTYNNDSIAEMVASVQAQEHLAELVVVDNGNDEPLRRWLRDAADRDERIKLVGGHGNVGFGAGCNLGVAHATGEYLLLLNPDCLLEPGTLSRLIERFAARGDDWVAGVRLLNPDGSEQKGARRNLGTPGQWLVEAFKLNRLMPRLSGVNMSDQPLPNAPQPVPAISGAFMFMRRALYEREGGMDQSYFLHFEDLDFCLRLGRHGVKLMFVPDIACRHEKSQSRAPALWVEWQKVRSMRRYFLQNFADRWPRPALLAVWSVLSAGLMLRDLARMVPMPGHSRKASM